jgi:hypothetical protein
LRVSQNNSTKLVLYKNADTHFQHKGVTNFTEGEGVHRIKTIYVERADCSLEAEGILHLYLRYEHNTTSTPDGRTCHSNARVTDKLSSTRRIASRALNHADAAPRSYVHRSLVPGPTRCTNASACTVLRSSAPTMHECELLCPHVLSPIEISAPAAVVLFDQPWPGPCREDP